MKKLTILAIAALAISFASCKKDRTCTCTVTSSSSTTASNYVITIKKAKKKDAADFCQKTTWTNTSGSSTSSGTQDCKLS